MNRYNDWQSFSVVVLSLSLVPHMYAIFTYDRAVYDMQHNNIAAAQERLQQLLVNNPERPDVLYDNGMIAYMQKEYVTAGAYFHDAAVADSAPGDLKRYAYLQLGNSEAALAHWDAAIDAYQAALSLDSNDEYAAHNLATAQKMRDQEQQKPPEDSQQPSADDKKDDQQQHDEQQKDAEKSTQKDDEQENNEPGSSSPQQRNAKEQDQSSNSQSDAQKGKQSKEKSLPKSGDEREHAAHEEDSIDQDNEQQRSQHEQQDSQGSQDQQATDASTQTNNALPSDDSHQPSSEYQDTTNEQQLSSANDKMQEIQQSDEKAVAHNDSNTDASTMSPPATINPRIAQILELQEQRDTTANKQLITARTQKQKRNKEDGQHAW